MLLITLWYIYPIMKIGDNYQMKTSTDTKTGLTLEIEYLRSELIESGIKNGLNHPTTVYLSQELDRLLNKCKTDTSKSIN